MESAGKRRRGDNGLVADFLELRDSSMVQTGPKRRKKGKMADLTPTPGGSRQQRGEETPRSDLAGTVKEVIGAAHEASITPLRHSSTATTLTPTPGPSGPLVATPVVEETPRVEQRTLQSALKGIHSYSTLRRSTRSQSRVSFGKTITVAEYTPPHASGDSSLDRSSPTASRVQRRSLELEPVDEGEDEVVSESEHEGGSEHEEGSEEGESGSETDMATPGATHAQSPGKPSPKLETPQYSEFRPVRKSRSVSRVHKGKSVKRQASHPTRKPAKTLTRSLVRNLFMQSSRQRVTKTAMELVMKFSELYLKQASEDLAVYAAHARRKTVEVSDVVLLLHRQRAVTERESFEYLVNLHLPLDYIEELLPCALAGKKVYPHQTYS